MVKVLPTFQGWTIDTKLKQLRKVGRDKKTIQFLDFDSEMGNRILGMFIESLDMHMQEDREILEEIWS